MPYRLLALLATAPLLLAGEPVRIALDGRALVVNGCDTVPTGLFGVHAIDPKPEMVSDWGLTGVRQINFSLTGRSRAVGGAKGEAPFVKPNWQGLDFVLDCLGDRYRPPLPLDSKGDWRAQLRQAGRSLAESSLAAGLTGNVVEFWNEPYLNWAYRSLGSPRNNYHPRFYEHEGRVDGGRVTRKGDSQPLDHLRWQRLAAAREVTVTDRKTGESRREMQVNYGVALPPGAEEGDTFRGRSHWYWTDREEHTYTVVEAWHVRDPTQPAWWSGRQNLQFYLWMLLPFAEGLTSVEGHPPLIAGWDFDPSAADWAVWRELYRPVLDALPERLAGWTEHHYGVDPRHVLGWYEVATADALNRHGRWLQGWNTECGGRLDPAVYGPQGGEATAGRERLATATYHLRDILGLAAHAPAKVGGRTAHHPQHHPGIVDALRFLKPLRGRLLHAPSSDDDVWTVAAHSATRACLVLWNDGPEERQLNLDLVGPGGRAITQASRTQLALSADGQAVEPIGKAVVVSDGRVRAAFPLAGRNACRLDLQLATASTPAETVVRSQHFAPLVLARLERGGRLATAITVSEASQARRARLRLVMTGFEREHLRLSVNGAPLTLGNDPVLDLPLEPTGLGPRTVVTLENAGRPGRFCTASILLDR